MSETIAFDAWLDRFFDFYLRRHPVDATFIGEHQFDHTLPDFSDAGNRAAEREMLALLEELGSVPSDELSEAQRHDRTLAEGFLEIQLWENESEHFHRGNPSLYTGEAIFSILAIRDNVAPPTINLDDPSVETAIDLVPHKARKRQIDVVLSNSFGFGGTNASLIVKRAS